MSQQRAFKRSSMLTFVTLTWASGVIPRKTLSKKYLSITTLSSYQLQHWITLAAEWFSSVYFYLVCLFFHSYPTCGIVFLKNLSSCLWTNAWHPINNAETISSTFKASNHRFLPGGLTCDSAVQQRNPCCCFRGIQSTSGKLSGISSTYFSISLGSVWIKMWSVNRKD